MERKEVNNLLNTKVKEINMLNDAMFKSVIRSKEARPVVNNFLHFLTNIQMDKLETATYMADLRTVLDEAR